MGRPYREPDPELLERRHELTATVRELDDEAATELAAKTWRLWMAARDIGDGRAFLRDVLDRPQPPQTRWRVLALYGDGLLAFWDDDAEAARRRNEEAYALAKKLGDDEALLFAQLGLSRVAMEDGDSRRARELAAGARELAPPFGEAMQQAPLHMEAQAARQAGDYDTAAALFEQSLALNRRIDDPGMVVVELQNLGLVEIRRGQVAAAERYFAELPPPDDPYGHALAGLNDAAVAFRKGDAAGARNRLAGVDETVFASDDRAELDWLAEQLV